VRQLAVQRSHLYTTYQPTTKKALQNPPNLPPLIVSVLAATSVPKLRQMLCEQSVFLRSKVSVPAVKDELFKNKQEMHDRQMLGDHRSEDEIHSSQKFKRVISQKAF
jgi:hypothetical protein